MSAQVLATKLYIPKLAAESVARPRLTEQLNQGLAGDLTLVSAPAGYGKSTLVAAWIKEAGHAACWLSLDARDSDPERFLRHFVAALKTISTDIGTNIVDWLDSPQLPPLDALITDLLNDITTIEHEFLFVLDDYHTIDNPEIDEALIFILDNQPLQMHLVITTREDPSFALSRMRARGKLSEIRISDLRFTETETADFLNRTMQLDLDSEAVATLDSRTEGWIVGLQLAAISMAGLSDKDTFLRSFTGSHRFILDYLVEEVLQRQPEAVRNFLFQTSILDRLNGALCDAVTEGVDGQSMLERLERSNMLILPLDEQREWYRYHHLFGDVLKTYAIRQFPDQVSHWHDRASSWFGRNGFRADAIRYAFAADNFERAASLVEQTWPEMYYGVRPMTWLSWARKLPEELVRVRPVLSAAYGWMLLDKGELDEADQRLRTVEYWLGELSEAASPSEVFDAGMVVDNEAEFDSLAGSTASARAYFALNTGDIAGAISYAQQSLELLRASDYFWVGGSALFLGLAQWSTGDLGAAYISLAESATNQRKAHSHYFETFGIVMMADVRLEQGRLQDTHQLYQQAQQLVASGAERGSQVVQGPVDLYSGLSDLHREWNDLDNAARYISYGQKVVKQAILPGSAYRLVCIRARLSEALGDYEQALAFLQEAEAVYQTTAVPDLYPILALKARMWVRGGHLDLARNWVMQRRLSVDDELTFLNLFDYATYARVLLAEYESHASQDDGMLSKALALLERLVSASEESGRHRLGVEISILQAHAYHLAGEQSHSLRALAQALTQAEAEGYVRVFLDEGDTMQQILSEAMTQGLVSDYALKLLTLFSSTGADAHQADVNQLLIEPLSQRELEVLHLVALGHTNQAVADELFIALSTVKKHTNNIFGKLGVTSRTQAVARARQLGLF